MERWSGFHPVDSRVCPLLSLCCSSLRKHQECLHIPETICPGARQQLINALEFKHPEISPTPQCLSVYHQLHEDAIRHGYWAAVDGVNPTHHGRPAHVRHCIDYLRQSLMCHADTNLEPIQADLAGVTGFGSEKNCRDYGRVTAWADIWRPEAGMSSEH
ncbi:hypothetical protein F5Y12DRAFT_749652 [Xylaria sp. FL1777]|nr:hypothetical protein F5Y12DRAFT_749652 [Xylaria sp. FL1777]